MKITIIGAGKVGSALGKAWAKAGHYIVFGVRNPGQGRTQPPLEEIGVGATSMTVPDAARASDIIVLATPWPAVPDAIRAMGELRGKVLIDCTNPLSLAGDGSLSLSLGSTHSGAEEVAKLAGGANVVKAFNTYGWENFADSAYPNAAALKPVMFYCGDHDEAKATVHQLAAAIGFEPVDTGGLGMSRSLEPLALLWIRLNIREGRNANFTWARLTR
ncbi:MAG: NADPH-dependent F420 reductase [Opitutae bacterium]|nr:NADPH-dependent F420 reductase [Opitutae bacterium]